MNPEVKKLAAERDALARKIGALILDFENAHGLIAENVNVRRIVVTSPIGQKRRQLSVFLSMRIPETELPPMTLAPTSDEEAASDLDIAVQAAVKLIYQRPDLVRAEMPESVDEVRALFDWAEEHKRECQEAGF